MIKRQFILRYLSMMFIINSFSCMEEDQRLIPTPTNADSKIVNYCDSLNYLYCNLTYDSSDSLISSAQKWIDALSIEALPFSCGIKYLNLSSKLLRRQHKPDSSLYVVNLALDQYYQNQIPEDSMYYVTLVLKADILIRQFKEFESAENILNSVYKNTARSKHNVQISFDALYLLASVNRQQFNFLSAENYARMLTASLESCSLLDTQMMIKSKIVLGNIMFDQLKFSQADSLYSEIIVTAQNHLNLRFRLPYLYRVHSLILLNSHKFGRALKSTKLLIEVDSTNLESQFNYWYLEGLVAWQGENLHHSYISYEKANVILQQMENAPIHIVDFQTNFGELLLKLGKLQQALKLNNSNIEIYGTNPDSAEYAKYNDLDFLNSLAHRANIFSQMGKNQNDEILINKSISLIERIDDFIQGAIVNDDDSYLKLNSQFHFLYDMWLDNLMLKPSVNAYRILEIMDRRKGGLLYRDMITFNPELRKIKNKIQSLKAVVSIDDNTNLRDNLVELIEDYRIGANQSLVIKHGNYKDQLLQLINSNKNQNILCYYLGHEISLVAAIRNDFITIKKIEIDGRFYDYLSGLSNIQSTAEKSLDSIFHQLFNYLLHPIVDDLRASKVYIVPDMLLYKLPFEMLQSPDTKELFLDRYDVSYAFSLKSILRINSQERIERRPENISIFSFSDPTSTLLSDQSLFPELPGGYNESLHILSLFEEKNTELYSGYGANKKNFFKAIRTSDVIHLALHAYSSSGDPYSNKIFFRNKNGINELSWYELSTITAQSQLVFLSSCDSGSGYLFNHEEGIYSLARSFAISGVQNIVSTLWKVDDDESKELVSQFYTNYAHNNDIQSALSNAKRKLVSTNSGSAANIASFVHYVN